MTMFHGNIYYAVDSRNTGPFGGKAARATLKIYDTRNCAGPKHEISPDSVELRRQMLTDLRSMDGDRKAIDDYLLPYMT